MITSERRVSGEECISIIYVDIFKKYVIRFITNLLKRGFNQVLLSRKFFFYFN